MNVIRLIKSSRTFLLIAIAATVALGQNKMDDSNQRAAREVADTFAASFWQHLNFCVPFKEFSDKSMSVRVRSTKILEQLGFQGELVDSFSDEVLLRQYSNAMNVHFLAKAYFEQNPGKPLPKAVNEVYKHSQYRDHETAVPGRTFIFTSKDADEYLRFNQKVSDLIKTLLQAQKPKQMRTSDYISMDGNPDLGLPKGKAIYYFRRGLFSLTVVEINGDLKIVDIGLGN